MTASRSTPQPQSHSPWPEGKVPVPAGTDGRPSWVLLAVVIFTGPTVWAVHLVGASALVGGACSRGLTWTINVLSVVCALLIAAALVPAVRLIRDHRPGGPVPDTVLAFVGILGVLWGSISLLVTVLEGVPNLVIDACPV